MTDDSIRKLEDTIHALRMQHDALVRKMAEIDPELDMAFQADRNVTELLGSVRERLRSMKRMADLALHYPRKTSETS